MPFTVEPWLPPPTYQKTFEKVLQALARSISSVSQPVESVRHSSGGLGGGAPPRLVTDTSDRHMELPGSCFGSSLSGLQGGGQGGPSVPSVRCEWPRTPPPQSQPKHPQGCDRPPTPSYALLHTFRVEPARRGGRQNAGPPSPRLPSSAGTSLCGQRPAVAARVPGWAQRHAAKGRVKDRLSTRSGSAARALTSQWQETRKPTHWKTTSTALLSVTINYQQSIVSRNLGSRAGRVL